MPTELNNTTAMGSGSGLGLGSEQEDYKLSLHERIICATAGAMLTTMMVTPLDVVKVRLQAQAEERSKAEGIPCSKAKNPANCPRCTYFNLHTGLMDHKMPKTMFHGCTPEAETVRFSGTFDALVKIPRREGVRALYNGLPPTLVASIPATVLYFASYDKMKINFDGRGWDWRVSSIVAGTSARIIAATMVSPLELIRTKIMATKDPPNMVMAYVTQVRSGGFLSLWRGLSPTLFRDVPFSSVYWVSVESMKRYLTENYMHIFLDKRVVSFVAGLTGGAAAGVFTQPFDVVKTRRQVFDYSGDAVLSQSRKMTMWAIMRRIVEEEGIRGLYTGIVPRISRVAPACAIMLSSYEAG